MELSTRCHAGDLIGFEAYAINQAAGSNADTVKITGFNVSQGNVFGSAGYPIEYNQQPNYWIGQAMNSGHQTYQISLAVTSGLVRPRTVNVYWDPFIYAL